MWEVDSGESVLSKMKKKLLKFEINISQLVYASECKGRNSA
jgi:hypothetical protein